MTRRGIEKQICRKDEGLEEERTRIQGEPKAVQAEYQFEMIQLHLRSPAVVNRLFVFTSLLAAFAPSRIFCVSFCFH